MSQDGIRLALREFLLNGYVIENTNYKEQKQCRYM